MDEILEILKNELEVYTFKGKSYNHEIKIIRLKDDKLSLNEFNMEEDKFKKLLEWLEG